jgi:hypothetical protein
MKAEGGGMKDEGGRQEQGPLSLRERVRVREAWALNMSVVRRN